MSTQDDLPIGPELDAAVAEEVFGAEWQPVHDGAPRGVTHWLMPSGMRRVYAERKQDGGVKYFHMPRWSRHMMYAWEVVLRLRDEDIFIDIDTTKSAFTARAGWAGTEDQDTWQTEYRVSEDAAAAICWVAIAAVRARRAAMAQAASRAVERAPQ